MSTIYDAEKETATEKALNILECFLPYNDELGNAELTEKTGYHRATTSRILKTLEKHGFLYQNTTNKKYRLGRKISQLNAAITSSLIPNIVSLAQPYLMELRNQTGDTVALDVMTSHEIIAALAYRGNAPAYLDIPVGMPVPWNTSNGARVMLAYASPKQQEAFFTQPMVKVARGSITDLEEYKSILIETRRLGYCFVVDDPVEGFAALSLPIFSSSGEPVAAVSISGLKDHIFQERDVLLEQLKKTTADISRHLSDR